jgi:hypothetical protein
MNNNNRTFTIHIHLLGTRNTYKGISLCLQVSVVMKLFLTLVFLLLNTVYGYTSIFNHWTCIGIPENIDFSKPYKINIGDLPLVVWQDKNTEQFIARINICKHMGSKLDNAAITSNGCLKCKYHGLEHTHEDRFGETMVHEGKLFWAYKPTQPKPPSIPFFGNPAFVHAFLEIDMDCSLTDSAFNTMDLRHPEYVHGGVFGFGNSIPPRNIVHYKYSDERVGLSFDYSSKNTISKLNMDTKETSNFHMFVYPTFSWSKVSFHRDKHLMIGVNLLPLENKKTRWYITVCNNYLKTYAQQQFMKLLATTILSQDYLQMRNQHVEDDLKRQIMFEHVFDDDEVILWVRDMFKEYRYPDTQACVDLYKTK